MSGKSGSRLTRAAIWGLVRGGVALAGVSGPAAVGMHMAGVWGADQLILPPPGAPRSSWSWQRRDMMFDLARAGVYAAATHAGLQLLKARRRR
jgi:hypothetical protein